jgi:hypothetical protein
VVAYRSGASELRRAGDVPHDFRGALLRNERAAVPVEHSKERQRVVAGHNGL